MTSQSDTRELADMPAIDALRAAFARLGDDPDELAAAIERTAGVETAENLRDLLQAVGQVLDEGARTTG